MKSGRAIGLLVLAAVAAWGYQAQPAAGSIEGQVVHASTGAPLRKATVQLAEVAPGQLHRTQEVDGEGKFAFTGLGPGTYLLSAERPRFLRHEYGARRFSGAATPIRISGDQHVRDILIKLSPQSAITGKVVDEDGEGLVSIPVQALKRESALGRTQWAPVAGAQTSDLGEYRIAGLAPGKYLVVTMPVRANVNPNPPGDEPFPAKPATTYSPTYYPAAADEANAVPIELPLGGEVHGIDIRERKAPTYWVRGRVEGVSPKQIGITVMLALRYRTSGTVLSARAYPPDYRFELRGVPSGSYLLHVSSGSDKQRMEAEAPVAVRDNHVDGVVLTMTSAGEIQGSVRVEDAGDTPVTVTGLQVILRPPMVIGGIPSSRVERGTNFTFRDVMPDHYQVVAARIPPDCYVKSIRYEGQEVSADGIDMAPGGTLAITLSATAGSVTANSVDADGKAIDGTTVVLLPKSGDAAPLTRTAESGAVQFFNLKPGEYRAFAFDDVLPGTWNDPDFVKKFLDRAIDVTVDPKSSQSIQLKAIPASETEQ